MTKYLIGYKQGDGSYVYVDTINSYKTSVTLDTNNALEFKDENMAKNVCEFVNYKEHEKTYIPLKVNLNVEEVANNVITSK